MEKPIFKNRREAGRQLALTLMQRGYKGENTLVLGVPRGGLIVAAEVAKALSAQLDVVLARKLRAPYEPELGMGAVVGNHVVLNEEAVRSVGASQDYLKREIAYQKGEVERRLKFYRNGHPEAEIAGRTVMVVDDGIATGYTFRACLESLLKGHPDKLVVAAPVASAESVEMLKPFADEVVCLLTPSSFSAVGDWYEKFDQLGDDEAALILRRNWSTLKLAA